MDKVIEKILTFLAVVVAVITSFLIALPFLILKYGVIAIAIYVVYRIGCYLLT